MEFSDDRLLHSSAITEFEITNRTVNRAAMNLMGIVALCVIEGVICCVTFGGVAEGYSVHRHHSPQMDFHPSAASANHTLMCAWDHYNDAQSRYEANCCRLAAAGWTF